MDERCAVESALRDDVCQGAAHRLPQFGSAFARHALVVIADQCIGADQSEFGREDADIELFSRRGVGGLPFPERAEAWPIVAPNGEEWMRVSTLRCGAGEYDESLWSIHGRSPFR